MSDQSFMTDTVAALVERGFDEAVARDMAATMLHEIKLSQAHHDRMMADWRKAVGLTTESP